MRLLCALAIALSLASPLAAQQTPQGPQDPGVVTPAVDLTALQDQITALRLQIEKLAVNQPPSPDELNKSTASFVSAYAKAEAKGLTQCKAVKGELEIRSNVLTGDVQVVCVAKRK